MKITQSKESRLRLHSKQQLAVTKFKLYLDNGLRVEKAACKFLGCKNYCGAQHSFCNAFNILHCREQVFYPLNYASRKS